MGSESREIIIIKKIMMIMMMMMIIQSCIYSQVLMTDLYQVESNYLNKHQDMDMKTLRTQW